MTDQELMDGAASIARDLVLPNGRKLRLAKVITPHLSWFHAARQRGLTWDDIIDILFDVGVKRANGSRLSRGHLSSLIPRKSDGLARIQTAELPSVRQPAPTSPERRRRPQEERRDPPDPDRPIRATCVKRPTAVSETRSSSSEVMSEVRAPQASSHGKPALLARLERAARARRHPVD